MFDKLEELGYAALAVVLPWLGYTHYRIDKLQQEDSDLKVAVARIDENVKFLCEKHERKDT